MDSYIVYILSLNSGHKEAVESEDIKEDITFMFSRSTYWNF